MQKFAKQNKGIRYLLTVIDIFSKYVWVVPLKTKTGKEVATAFKKIFKQRKPNRIWTDLGKEFYNSNVKALDVPLYSTQNEEKSCVVERFNRTLKERMYKYFTANSTDKYIDVLDLIVHDYNNTKHRSIKMTPTQASLKENHNEVYRNLYPLEKYKPLKPKFAVGDSVRISKRKGLFEHGFLPRWTEEIFVILSIQFTDPVTYKIKDYNGEEIQGTFYEKELQKSQQDVFRIERVIRRKGNKSFVKWKGYPDSFNSWIDNTKIL